MTWWRSSTGSTLQGWARVRRWASLGIRHPSALESASVSLRPKGAYSLRGHSIGGLGSVTTNKLLATIMGELFGKYVQAYPRYGSEKKGLPDDLLPDARRRADPRPLRAEDGRLRATSRRVRLPPGCTDRPRRWRDRLRAERAHRSSGHLGVGSRDGTRRDDAPGHTVDSPRYRRDGAPSRPAPGARAPNAGRRVGRRLPAGLAVRCGSGLWPRRAA